jgi:AcrR family transcriptional regulator
MSLLEEQKTERRARILAAARRLIAEHGYEGLTMRELAHASHVSVPTLYNLFGGKQALLLGELEETFAAVAAALERARGRSFVERAVAACEAGNRDLLSVPRYSRELVHLFLVSDETRPIRKQNQERYIAMMARLLAEARAAGELVAWAEPEAVARRMFAHYVQAMIEWAKGDLDAEEFRAATVLGMCLMLLGLARGRAARELERRARETQAHLQPGPGPARRKRGQRGG